MNLLYRRRSLLRRDLSEELGLTGAAVSRITRELIDAGFVEEKVLSERKGVRGRRRSSLKIRSEGAFVLAITITANRKSVGLFNAKRENCGQINLDDNREMRTPEKTIGALTSAAQKLLLQSEVQFNRVMGVGIGVAMHASDLKTSKELVSSSVLGWQDVPLRALVENQLQLPVAVEARASALLRAQLDQRAATHSKDIFLINVGLGIGTAGIFSGRMFAEDKPGFGSLSHIRHPASEALCRCGRTGCLEQSAAGAAVVADFIEQKALEQHSFEKLGPLLAQSSASAKTGDQRARDAFFEAGRKMATGVDTVLAMLKPDQILLAGQTGRQPDYIAGLRFGLKELNAPLDDDVLAISTATSSEASAAIALDAFVYSENLNLERLRVT